MENDDTENSDNQSSEKTPPTAPNVQADTKSKPTQRGKNKSRKHQKWSLIRHWKAASRRQQFRWIAELIGGLIALSIPVVYYWDHFQRERQFRKEHAPLVIHNVPPKFLQTYKCIPASHIKHEPNEIPTGSFGTGDMDITFKNIGTDTAYDVNEIGSDFAEVIPQKRTGTPVDQGLQVTQSDCFPKFRLPGAPLEPGIEQTIHSGVGGATVAAQVTDKDLVSFEYKTCVHYADSEGQQHATCDVYLLRTHDVSDPRLANDPIGTDQLPCDEVERHGEFFPIIGAHCQQ